MKGISVWIWVIAGFIIGIMMFVVSFQFITFISIAQQKELARENLDKLASNVNGLCTHHAGDKFTTTLAFPERVVSVYATKDTRFVPSSQKTSGNNLCMNFSKELICDDLDCNLDMKQISSSGNLQSLLNQYLGRFGTNSYDLQIIRTDCGISILQSGEATTIFCGACDPKSNGVPDGVCNLDCMKTKDICDPDCNGTIYEGNPNGLNDTKCFVCDGTCNGWCSQACNTNALPGNSGFDPDCYKEVNSSYFCIGDNLCEKDKRESCLNSADCPGGGAKCQDFNSVCCPASSDADASGCSKNKNNSQGGLCGCDNQCESDLECDKTGHCCPQGKVWDANTNTCIIGICPQDISTCFNHWHWDNYGNVFGMNVQGYTCDYYEICQNPVVNKIAEEITNCCNNKCSGDCHSLCNNAVLDSGLNSSNTEITRKYCYGLYAIYGLGPAARWMQGYIDSCLVYFDPSICLERPASIMLGQGGAGICTWYSISLTTLLRSVGYSSDEVYSQCGPQHAFNLVKFPGESQYRWVDTVGNGLYISGTTKPDWYLEKYGDCRSWGLANSNPGCGCQNDQGTFNCPSLSNVNKGVSC